MKIYEFILTFVIKNSLYLTNYLISYYVIICLFKQGQVTPWIWLLGFFMFLILVEKITVTMASTFIGF